MKISLKWLKNYLDLDLSAEELAKGLTEIGFDIESVENQADKFKNFIIGKVLEAKKHPNADKLSVCKVDVGKEILNIVCGAPNVAPNQFVCVAMEGAIIPNSGIELKKTKIRGEVSEGMICSAREMNLGDDSEGIMVLEEFEPLSNFRNQLKIGKSFSEYIGEDDSVFDIGITPNRGDLLSHIGIAREAACLINKKIKLPEIKRGKSSDEITGYITVEIDNSDACRRYYGCFVKNVTVKESPRWIKDYLTAVGLRPINNIVDITNFVMLECGQPLHAFDYEVIAGKKIIVKDSGILKSFKTLDGKERKLRDDILLICDAEKPLGIAGIMGGENSEITSQTKNVFIESAFFDPINIRKSSKFLGLQTDSSYRFERGVDIEMVEFACKRAAALISEYSDGKWVNGEIDVYPNKIEKRIIELRLQYLRKILGIEIPSQEVKDLLNRIDIVSIEQKEKSILLEIPYFRYYDLKNEIDLIEEVARLYGYSKIPDADFDYMYYDTRFRQTDNEIEFLNKIRNFLVGRGFKEIITNTLVNEEYAGMFDRDYIKLINPSSAEMNTIRNNLILGALETIKTNFNFKVGSLKLFEMGDAMKFNASTNLPLKGIEEENYLLLALSGEYDCEVLGQKTRLYDIYDLKGEVQVLLEKFNIDNYKLNDYNYNENFDFSTDIAVQDRIIAKIFKISDKCLKLFDIPQTVVCCEINLSQFLKHSQRERIYKEIPKYPPVLRDLSIVVSRDVKVNEIEKIIKSSSDSLLKSIRLYDVYYFGDENSNKKSYTFTLEFLSCEKTLTDEEVNKIQEKVISNLERKLKAELRK